MRQLILACALMSLLAAPLIDAMVDGRGRGGGGRGSGRRRSRGESLEEFEEVEEFSDYDGGKGDSAETNTGYTIKKLYGERNDPPSASYPRKSLSDPIDNTAKYTNDGVPNPPQQIRLRGNRSDMNPNEGRVEVRHQQSWGLVCDGHFGDTEASVTCKSLGFKRGAQTYRSGSFFGTGKFRPSDILMAQVRCSPYGEETQLSQCIHSHSTGCSLENTAGVECIYNDGCEWGWFGYDGLCYRVDRTPRTPDEAAEQCQTAGGSLAYVLSKGENNFISNLMHTTYRNISAVWTAGQFAQVEKRGRPLQDWVFKDSDHVIQKDKAFWFPAESRRKARQRGNDKHGGGEATQPHKRSIYLTANPQKRQGFADGSRIRPSLKQEKQSCLALSKIFNHKGSGKDTDVNYFWWDNVSCKTKLPYICQKLSVSSDCYNGTGVDYRGEATRTEDGGLCEPWTDEDNVDLQSPVRSQPSRSLYGGRSGRGRFLGRKSFGYRGGRSPNHNFCRNPDNEKKPWCWVNRKQGIYGYCNIQQCGTVTPAPSAVPSPRYPQASFNNSMCQRRDQFFCPSMINYRPRCVERIDVCDGYNDCIGAEDENATFCRTYKCKKEDFYCSKIHTCIPISRVCDKHYDCDYGDDETPEACQKHRPPTVDVEAEILKKYRKSPNVAEDSIPDTAVTVRYITLTLLQCKIKCDRPDDNMLTTCAGFMFSKTGEFGTECILLAAKLPSVTAGESAEFAYYEKIETCNSATQMTCDNGHCISRGNMCNGFDDCGDFSDEIGPPACPNPRPTFEVRLSSGKGTYEGRIEVKLFKEWGLVCDNGLDASMGDLVCRQLGFPLGHERLIHNARWEFGRGSGKYLMSSANCSGVSTSLFDCPHAGWKVWSNCGISNVAGLVCRRQRACTLKEFRCSGICVPLSSVCDKVRDCPDGADEAKCGAMTLALREGNSSKSGVLEVTRGGIPGAICDDNFADKEVQVACRTLGFTGRGRKLPAGTFSAPENLVMWVQDVRCRLGTEAKLFDCNIANWGRTICDIKEAVNIECGLNPVPVTPPPPPTTTASRPSTAAPSVATCGQRIGRFPAGRIVNGYQAIVGQFPWQVGIRLRLSSTESQQWCGGTVISDRWLVTAAHCFEDYPKSSYILRIGDVDNTVKEALEREFDIDLLIKHASYTGSPMFDYDIAMIRIKPDRQGYLTFNDAIQPACLPDKNLVAPKNTVCHISGWGSMGTMDLPKNLMAANVPLIENAKCNQLYTNRITDRMQCAGFEAGGIDSCQGDSGGPLVCKIDDRYILLGATSWGEGCALPGAPGVYANVRNLRDWIDQTIRSNP